MTRPGMASIEDQHRRYWRDVRRIEQGLAASASTPAARRPALLAALATETLAVLEREPSEPKLLGYAGVILCELWSLDAAEAMFVAAKRLDGQLGDVERNLEALTARRSQHNSADRAPLRAAPPELSRQALEIAARAQPAEGLRLSLCMIVRDEQEMLPRCLAAVAGAIDELVIVDTGSTDATIEIARSFGARVIEYEWTGSFAEARNVSFAAASGDWLMYLDADEVLVREDAQLLRSLTGRTWREAFYLAETNYTGDPDDGGAVAHNALRVFRNRPEYRFEGRLHEQIAHRLPGYLPERIEATSVRVEHYGYLSAVRDSRDKSRRNIELLRLQQAESSPTPFLHYNLGCEYAAAGDRVAALVEFERSWELLEAAPDRVVHKFAPALLSRLVKALRVCDRPQDALARAEEGLERFPDFTDLVLEQALAAIALGQSDHAIELCERCIEMGDAPPPYTATVGAGSYLPRLHLADLRRARGEHQQAIEQLEHCLREHPRFSGSVLPYASTLLASGMEPGAVVEELERHMPDPAPAARFMLGTALYGAGAGDAAKEQFARVLECTGASEVVLSREAVPLLEAMLEALLRVQDFQGFEALLGLLERTPLRERERRELLAEMYLRRGFAVSAAQEWMAVCEQEPDVQALLGLARVATARGMSREASDFTAAAQGMSHLQEILQVSAGGVDDGNERKREAAHGLDRVTRFQGENAI